MSDSPEPGDLPLNRGADQLLKSVTGDAPGVRRWLLEVLERYGPMAADLAGGLDARATINQIQTDLRKGDEGAPLTSEVLLRSSRQRAAGASKKLVTERDVVAVVLAAAGLELKAPSLAQASSAAPARISDPSKNADEPPVRLIRPTPTLDQFGRDLTREASNGRLGVVLGRDLEIDLVVETLCRRIKRNPLLVGPAGTGKTAIVEGVALRIAAGAVPALLKGARIVSLQPSALVAGAGVVGELDRRMKAIVSEASQDGVVLFIDEVHAMIGAGGREGTGDVASMLKPALARGELACIAATTDDEFRRFIEADRALERRFNPVRVTELSAAQTFAILEKLRDAAGADRRIAVSDDLLRWLVDVAQRFLPHRRFPDKAIDLFDQCVAFAVSRQRERLEHDDAELVVTRMLGRPEVDTDRFARLEAQLVSHGLIEAEAAHEVAALLELRSRGLDPRSERPDLTIVVGAEMAERAMELASVLSEGLFGAADRVIRIDLGLLRSAEDLRVLLGAPASFVGYQDRHLLDALADMPCSVVVFERADEAHSQVADALAPGLRDGVLRDMRGRQIYFSDAVVILTVAAGAEGAGGSIGFHQTTELPSSGEDRTRERLDLEDSADFVFFTPPVAASAGLPPWIERNVLGALARRHRDRGIELVWDSSVLAWLGAAYASDRDERAIERLVEREIGTVLLRDVWSAPGQGNSRVVVRRLGEKVVAQPAIDRVAGP